MKKCTSFEEQRGTGYIRENVYFSIVVFSCLSAIKACPRFLSICFTPGVKAFYQGSLGNKVDLKGKMSVSPNILAKD